MAHSSSRIRSKRPSAYQVAWGLFACLAVSQLIAIGSAIAVRSGEVREVVRYVREDPIVISVPAAPEARAPREGEAIAPRSLEQLMLAYGEDASVTMELGQAPQVSLPEQNVKGLSQARPANEEAAIARSDVRKLVEEAEAARKRGDAIQALILLDDAAALSEEEPLVWWRKAEVFEVMGQWERAADCYERLFIQGPDIGIYYHNAAYKLSNGIEPESSKNDQFALGHIMKRLSHDGMQVQLRVPVKLLNQERFDPEDIHLIVHHYDLVDKHRVEPVPESRADQMNERWVYAPVDWSSGEEIAEANYTVAEMSASESHLFGQRSYFGYVVELYYQNELVDQQANPRKLHSIHAKQQVTPSYGLPFDGELPPMNEGNPLLPNLPSEY
ncbi:hypothetical protein [Rubritalea marina]|uniref:hypothetical protein n=1 Tax=Rubritalea marina TaxID=361055 RepID=UPI0012EA49BE|nr:hypothetical protein [Rubritalea marina]